MTEQTCGRCRFWSRFAPLQPNGSCRRVPPTPIMVGVKDGQAIINTYWPTTQDVTLSCGEYAERERGVTLDLAAVPVEAIEGSA